MLTIWKYKIPIEDQFVVSMPQGAQILTVQVQYEQPAIWVLVDPKQTEQARSFRMSGTGHPMSDAETTNYIGTFQIRGGDLVFHLFEINQKVKGA